MIGDIFVFFDCQVDSHLFEPVHPHVAFFFYKNDAQIITFNNRRWADCSCFAFVVE